MNQQERNSTAEKEFDKGNPAATPEYESPTISVLGSVDQLTAGQPAPGPTPNGTTPTTT